MKEIFDFDKTVQATAYLLNKSAGQISLIKLLKLLYIADREYLFKYGFSITGDTMYTYQYGPVLEKVYNLLKGKIAEYPQWDEYIKTDDSDNKMVSVLKDPGVGDLSRAEMATLNLIVSEFGSMNEEEIVNYTHTFTEWKSNYNPQSKVEVDAETILHLNGYDNLIPTYKKHVLVKEEFNKLFESCGI